MNFKKIQNKIFESIAIRTAILKRFWNMSMCVQKYFVSVSEPWDYESANGQDIIKGRILDKKSNDCIVFESDDFTQFDDIKSNILILTP